MTNATAVVSVVGTLVFIGGFWILLPEDHVDKMNEGEVTVEESYTPPQAAGTGSWGDTKDNGDPIVYQKNRILDYGGFTVQYDVWFEYAKVSSGQTDILRSAVSMDGTRYTSKDGTVELTVVDGVGTLSRNGQVVASGELTNREAVENSGPASCMEVTDEVIEGCE